MSLTPTRRQLIEAHMFAKIQAMPIPEFAALDALLQHSEIFHEQAAKTLPADYLNSPNRIVKDTVESNMMISTDLLIKWRKANRPQDGGDLFEQALLLSVTNLYLAENLVAEVDFSTHPLFQKEPAEADTAISNP